MTDPLTGRPLKRDRTGAAPEAGTPEQRLAWALLSTALLALWLGWNNSWQFALAGVAGIFVHELGHALTINAFRLGPSRIHLIPFFGGLATQPKPSPNEMTAVLIALAGPSFGLLAAIPFFIAFGLTGDTAWRDGVVFIAIINLLNLFPARPFDGARAIGPVLARIHPAVEFVVAGLLGLLAIYWSITSGLWIIAAVVGFALFGLWRDRNNPTLRLPLKIGEAFAAVGLYLLTAILCVAVVLIVLIQEILLNPGALSGV